jgi:signal transduction histidine kinase
MERYELFSALREGAIARERLGIARDLHDGIVQFLAGSAYKIEAISRSTATGVGVADDLQELKRLMLLEQEDLRSSIGTLRKDNVDLSHTEAQAAALCDRLSQQWRVQCQWSAQVPDGRIPARLHMDLLHMIKEGVANAVRHGSATAVRIGLCANAQQLELAIQDNGVSNKAGSVPWSIRERMSEIGGSASVTTQDGFTRLFVVAPVRNGAE